MGTTMRLEDHSGYAAATAKLAEVRVQITDTKTQIRVLERGLQTPVTAIEEQAAAYLSGSTLATIDKEGLRGQYSQCLHQLEVLDAAEGLARRAVEREREAASKEICKAMAGEWSGLVKRMRDAARVLAAAGECEHTLREDLRRGGVFITAPMSDQAGMSESLRWMVGEIAKSAEDVL
jgi:hypothetical protein